MRRLERAGKQTKLQRETFKAAGNNTEARNQSQRLKAIEEKYQLIADKTGIKAQYERMVTVKSTASVKKNVDFSGGSGIIKEQSKKHITVITDNAIENVPKVQISGFTDEQNTFIHEQHKDLLKYARDNNGHKEVAFVFRDGLVDREAFLGSDDVIEFGSGLIGKGDNLFVMHNHPRNSNFSKTDIDEFINNNSIKTLSIVKNNGDITAITKTGMYDFESAFIAKQRHIKKYVVQKTEVEYDILVDKLLKYYEKKGIIEWIK